MYMFGDDKILVFFVDRTLLLSLHLVRIVELSVKFVGEQDVYGVRGTLRNLNQPLNLRPLKGTLS